ncbi:MAG TPA: methyltransferase domain-containing protein [Puia sp.]|nr:methyltransferase domain-containing protein [Puia sp.]
MNDLQHRRNEQEAAKAFSKQSLLFDEYDAGNTIIKYKRERVRGHVLQYLPPASSILELNAGTGEDATYFGRLGHRVHATDIAEGMQQALREKIIRQELTGKITTELCSFTSLEELRNKGPFDLIFSNFAGLNCTGELDKVLRSFSPLVNPGGQLTLVILPGFCLWETLLVFRGKFKTAFRRLFSRRKGARSHVEGHYFQCWYYSPSYVIRHLEDSFDLLSVEGLCTLVPPSYIEHFAERHPRLYRTLRKWEDRRKGKWPWKYIGDYYIISFRKKG